MQDGWIPVGVIWLGYLQLIGCLFITLVPFTLFGSWNGSKLYPTFAKTKILSSVLTIRAHLHQATSLCAIIHEAPSTDFVRVHAEHDLGPEVDHLQGSFTSPLTLNIFIQGNLIKLYNLFICRACK